MARERRERGERKPPLPDPGKKGEQKPDSALRGMR
jgi:hypothetical protein